MDPNQTNIDTELKEAFAALPKIVQNAITSADVEKQMRAVSDNYKLHLDQWGKLENEVMLTLLGLQDAGDLASNIQNEIGVTAEQAASLAADINKIIFAPIRAELERGLEHPEAKEKEVSGAEAARQTLLAAEEPVAAATPQTAEVTAPVAAPTTPAAAPAAVTPATPPAEKPAEKAVRAPMSSSYLSRQASSERKSVDGDPYRELPH
jgi:hypothetical protein